MPRRNFLDDIASLGINAQPLFPSTRFTGVPLVPEEARAQGQALGVMADPRFRQVQMAQPMDPTLQANISKTQSAALDQMKFSQVDMAAALEARRKVAQEHYEALERARLAAQDAERSRLAGKSAPQPKPRQKRP